MHLHPHLASERRQGMLAQAGQGTSMTAGMYPVPGWLSFRRIVDIPFGTCLAALESWQRTRHDGEVHIGNSRLRGPDHPRSPLRHTPDRGRPGPVAAAPTAAHEAGH
jgi:hypothetical protein